MVVILDWSRHAGREGFRLDDRQIIFIFSLFHFFRFFLNGTPNISNSCK